MGMSIPDRAGPDRPSPSPLRRGRNLECGGICRREAERFDNSRWWRGMDSGKIGNYTMHTKWVKKKMLFEGKLEEKKKKLFWECRNQRVPRVTLPGLQASHLLPKEQKKKKKTHSFTFVIPPSLMAVASSPPPPPPRPPHPCHLRLIDLIGLWPRFPLGFLPQLWFIFFFWILNQFWANSRSWVPFFLAFLVVFRLFFWVLFFPPVFTWGSRKRLPSGAIGSFPSTGTPFPLCPFFFFLLDQILFILGLRH